MSDYGIKSTTQGKSVTSTNELDYSFWSKYPIYKIDEVAENNYTDVATVSLQGDRHFSIGTKQANKWYMAGASGPTNAGNAKLYSAATFWTEDPGFAQVIYNWTLECTGSNSYRAYTTIDSISGIF